MQIYKLQNKFAQHYQAEGENSGFCQEWSWSRSFLVAEVLDKVHLANTWAN